MMSIFLTLGMLIACTVYTLFPNGQSLRPALYNYDDPFCRLIRFIYSNDTPANCAPSIHVIYSVAAHSAITAYNKKRKRIAWISVLSLNFAIVCIVSTVFIKQHSVIDLISGLLLSGMLYCIIYRFNNSHNSVTL
jgi:membrane-associated phospholipid phosphatase